MRIGYLIANLRRGYELIISHRIFIAIGTIGIFYFYFEINLKYDWISLESRVKNLL